MLVLLEIALESQSEEFNRMLGSNNP